ncbi:myoneurin-like [Zerene cesonia]|uniref:myoneurin-like n=1 Tax=Zerene cesonia TaxID=33412 RepID=UPI0018E55551|nr:myoneurin-like [Zerene cesonia]
MNKKPGRTGPRIRITRPALRRKPEESLQQNLDNPNYIYTCPYCCVKFTQNSHFFRHMTSNHQLQQRQAVFECNDCHVIFIKKSSLDIHCQTHHQVKSKSRCESCAITFRSRYCLRRHLKLKQILAENSCVKCQKKFTSKERLSKHYNNKHTYKHVTFECDFCPLKFKAKQSLMSHLNRIHNKL